MFDYFSTYIFVMGHDPAKKKPFIKKDLMTSGADDRT